jgi:hypothetical protein
VGNECRNPNQLYQTLKGVGGWGKEKEHDVQDVLAAEDRSQRRGLRRVLFSVDEFSVFVHMYYAYYQIH